ncbi:hypothetical protein AKJ09_02521 [Labilithrix luteola]|uniref:Purine nucleoside phosphorylase n=1 Tax=Labilithrix luteola TaxID=1391654 RepID=A0A0K1PQQ4_9BACT|nr:polyphenol oxidase family protein [Labilithrix luteola]AKU95857.1 hypothetical protein AKJ09_02521 [Labilithrix luteola]
MDRGAGLRATSLLRLLRSRQLSALGFKHGFTTRAGGVSEPPFDTLDFAILRTPELRRENERRLGEAVGFVGSKLHHARQVHGREVVVADGNVEGMLAVEADAVVAEPSSGFAVAARVADCGPVLVADPSTGRVAAIHAGWPGVVAGVVPAAIERLVSANGAGKASGFVAAIGPCIGSCCFEVGDDVCAKIVGVSSNAVVVRREVERQKAWVDLRRSIRIQLVTAGLADASIDDVPGKGSESCTVCNATSFYSYRRDGDASGRQLGVIVPR